MYKILISFWRKVHLKLVMIGEAFKEKLSNKTQVHSLYLYLKFSEISCVDQL